MVLILRENQPTTSKLNDLDGKEWVKSTKSWFILNPQSRSRNQLEHPAKFPEELVARFVKFFTKSGAWVLDPFAGVGSTQVACKTLKRNSVGIELSQEFIDAGMSEIQRTEGTGDQLLLVGDSLDIAAVLETHFGEDVPQFDYLITSPPYWNMLKKSRGGNESTHKERAEKGLKQYYSSMSEDLGNIDSYEDYLESVGTVFDSVYPLMANEAYLTVVVQNMRDSDGSFRPIA
ncbi:MAG: DNA methyltransferase, partial [Candidatus Hermodarchaeota archaeon]